MATLKIPTKILHRNHRVSFFNKNYSSWWSLPPSPSPHQEDPLLKSVSDAIKIHSSSSSSSSSLKKLLPKLTTTHILTLINHNPHRLPPLSLLSFFNFLSSHPHIRLLTLQSYSTMTHFLVSHNLRSQALDLLRLVVSKKGNGSSSSVFSSLVETRGV
ncbi:hypothetical protein LWI29_019722 [Acer saccharum]|uniref:Pentatricopeptide repeat-containing protein n=1 Tax=Acer saccharum TaxID=4024 RepID=A0AA39VXQ4_ACESA|nr:hypothetical protein LWI29_019722 [Acer saccharum]